MNEMLAELRVGDVTGNRLKAEAVEKKEQEHDHAYEIVEHDQDHQEKQEQEDDYAYEMVEHDQAEKKRA